jgi:hypothetical protein
MPAEKGIRILPELSSEYYFLDKRKYLKRGNFTDTSYDKNPSFAYAYNQSRYTPVSQGLMSQQTGVQTTPEAKNLYKKVPILRGWEKPCPISCREALRKRVV